MALTCFCLAADAFAAAPDDLLKQVVGVVGSGDELSLKLTSDGGSRTLKVGEIYQDGWRLQSLSAAEAVLTKAGESRRIGLNPSGALARTPSGEAPSKVDLAGDTDADILRKLAETDQLGKREGLSPEESTRMAVYKARMEQAMRAKIAADGASDSFDLTLSEIRAALGADFDAWRALDARETAALQAQSARQFAATGPVSFYVPANSDETVVAKLSAAAGVPADQPAAYNMGAKDASGGRVYTRKPVNYISDAQAAAEAGP